MPKLVVAKNASALYFGTDAAAAVAGSAAVAGPSAGGWLLLQAANTRVLAIKIVHALMLRIEIASLKNVRRPAILVPERIAGLFDPAYFKAINYNAVDVNVDALIPKIADRGSDKRLNFDIREATPADRATIAGFNSRMAEETEGKTLDPDVIGPGVGAVLADPTKGRYWMATVDGEIAGQIMITYEWSDWRNGMLWWIQSVYVPLRFRRQGVFSALYKHVESIARADKNVRGLRLYVENSNQRAQDIYRALNMTQPYLVMESIFGNQEEE